MISISNNLPNSMSTKLNPPYLWFDTSEYVRDRRSDVFDLKKRFADIRAKLDPHEGVMFGELYLFKSHFGNEKACKDVVLTRSYLDLFRTIH